MVLRAMSAELGGVALTLPFGRGLGRLPAQIAHGRRGVGHAQQGPDLAVVDGLAMHLAVTVLTVSGSAEADKERAERPAAARAQAALETENIMEILR